MRQLGRFRLEIAFAVFEPKFSKPKTTLKTSFCHFRPKKSICTSFSRTKLRLKSSISRF